MWMVPKYCCCQSKNNVEESSSEEKRSVVDIEKAMQSCDNINMRHTRNSLSDSHGSDTSGW